MREIQETNGVWRTYTATMHSTLCTLIRIARRIADFAVLHAYMYAVHVQLAHVRCNHECMSLLYVLLYLTVFSTLLCDVDENDFAMHLAQVLGWSWSDSGYAAALALLHFYSYASKVGRVYRRRCRI